MGLHGRHVGIKSALFHLCWLIVLSLKQGAEGSWQDGVALASLNKAWSQHISDLARASRSLATHPAQGNNAQKLGPSTGSRLLDALVGPQDAGEQKKKRGQDPFPESELAEVQGHGLGRHQIPAKYILMLKLGGSSGAWNVTMKAQLKSSLATLLGIPQNHVIITRIKSGSNTVELSFVKPGHDPENFRSEDLYPAREVEDALAASGLTRVLSGIVHVDDVSSQDGVVMKNVDFKKFLTAPYFPYVMAGAAVGLVCLLALMVWCCIRRSRGKGDPSSGRSSPSPPPHIPQQICLYPSAKPDVNINTATLIQPDITQIRTNKSCGECGTPLHGTPLHGTPVHTPPLRLKKGLLERRGSNASLTLDLGPTGPDSKPTWGSPPKESSAEEYLLSAGNRMTRKQLRNCLKDEKALHEEFWEIPMNHPDKVEVAGSGVKNRYRTIIPNELSRVRLPEVDSDPLSAYINANYIRGYAREPRAYIATQGPMAHTVIDFWRTVWHTKAPIVVMITKLKEKDKTKCESYMPDVRELFGDIEVQVDSFSQREGVEVRQLTLKYLDQRHTLLHYWYTTWPDHKAPNTARQLLDLVREVDRQRNDPETGKVKGPVVVHCSAGIGRTGCFIGTSIGMQQLRNEHMVDILGTVCSMRMDRGGMVQTNEQYEFIHQALCLYERELPDRPPSGE